MPSRPSSKSDSVPPSRSTASIQSLASPSAPAADQRAMVKARALCSAARVANAPGLTTAFSRVHQSMASLGGSLGSPPGGTSSLAMCRRPSRSAVSVPSARVSA